MKLIATLALLLAIAASAAAQVQERERNSGYVPSGTIYPDEPYWDDLYNNGDVYVGPAEDWSGLGPETSSSEALATSGVSQVYVDPVGGPRQAQVVIPPRLPFGRVPGPSTFYAKPYGPWAPPRFPWPRDPNVPPGPGFTRDAPNQAWHNKSTGESLRWDPAHGPYPSHWDYKPSKQAPWHRWYENGNLELKSPRVVIIARCFGCY
jgi:hypothetical protein